MIRIALLGTVMLAFAAALIGCKKSDAPRNDMPIKTTQEGTDPKTGKKAKSVGASLEEPPK